MRPLDFISMCNGLGDPITPASLESHPLFQVSDVRHYRALLPSPVGDEPYSHIHILRGQSPPSTQHNKEHSSLRIR